MEKHFLSNENIQNKFKKWLRAQDASFFSEYWNWLGDYGAK